MFTFVYTFVNMVERVKKILEEFRLSPSQLAETLNVQRSNISHILSGRNKPSLDLIQKILTEFPDLNSDWLLFGKGDMKKQKQPKPTPPEPKQAPLPKETSEISPTPSMDSALNVDNSPKEVNKPESPTYTPSESKTKPVSAKNKSVSKKKEDDKQIERIIIFNDDNTFKEYKPE